MNKYIEMTKGLNDKQLREVIGIMASASADANGALLDYLKKQGLVTPEQEKAQQIRTRKAEAAFRDIWLDASIVLEAMDDGDWEELTARGFTDYYFEDANIDSQVSRLEEIANKEPLSAEFRREMMELILDDISSSDYGDEGAVDLAESLCRTNEEILRFAELLEQYDSWGSSERIKRIYRRLKKDDELIEYMEDEIRHPQNAIDLYNTYMERGEKERAINYLWEGLRLSPHSSQIITMLLDISESDRDFELIRKLTPVGTKWMRYGSDNIAERIVNQLKKHSETDLLNAYIPEVFMASYGSSDASYWFERCMKDMDPESFKERESDLLEHLKKVSPADYYCYRIEQGFPEEALEALRNDGPKNRNIKHYYPLDRGLRISSMLVDTYPDEIEELYWKKAEFYGNNREFYSSCAGLMLALKEIAKSKDRISIWEQKFEDFVSRRKRRKYLIAAFKDAGLL